ncbi:MAG: DUF4625 domain-containing protein [Rikenellaceae bacterium]
MKKYYLLLALLSVGFVACDKEDGDTEKPSITITSPVEGGTYYVIPDSESDEEGELCIEGVLSDNEGLASLKVDLHTNCNHTTSLAKHDDDHVDQIDIATYDLEGVRNIDNLHKHLHIPYNAYIEDETGTQEYHLMIYCTDTSGNQSSVSMSIYLAKESSDPN